MAKSDELSDVDFDAQLRGLFQEAETLIEGRSTVERQVEQQKREIAEKAAAEKIAEKLAEEIGADEDAQIGLAARTAVGSLPKMLRPMVLGVEALTRLTAENSTVLQKLDKASGETVEAHKHLPQLVRELQTMVDQKNKVNDRMFDALHEELKGYKDGFLLESVHRPIIRDLITLYDDIAELRRQMQEALTEQVDAPDTSDSRLALLGRMQTLEMNLEHHLEFILEVLARLEVTLMPIGTGKLDKRTQRAVAVEIAEDPDDDNDVVRSVKRGFLWKERVMRAEEVVLRKWKEGFLVALAPASQK